jgi:archaemetzincin
VPARLLALTASLLATLFLSTHLRAEPPRPRAAQPPAGQPPAEQSSAPAEQAPAAQAPARKPAGPLGRLDGLALPLRRALEERDAFAPLPTPSGSDWLAVYDEPGQTFEQFRDGPRRVPTPERRTIRLVALDDVGDEGFPKVERLAEYLALYYGLPSRVHALTEPLPTFHTRTNESTGVPQILTTSVMRWLRTELPSDSLCLVAVTRRDLYPDPSWNFVFGQASPGSGVGVFSFARYHPEFPGSEVARSGEGAPTDAAERGRLVLRRSLKVLAHEVGHLVGLEHCVHFHCLMNGSNHLGEMDRAPQHLCPVCLRKAQHAATFDVVARYAALAAFYRAEALDDDAAWAAARADHARGK